MSKKEMAADERSRYLPQPDQLAGLPPCRSTCPSGTDIRGWITTIAQRNRLGLSDEEAYARAWKKIVDVNPFPAVMGRICPHPCEDGCNRREKDGAVAVHDLERFIGDWALEMDLQLPLLATGAKSESIGVVGSGPAGLSFAYQMARRGYPVTLYERYAEPGGMLRYGIPVFRLSESVLAAEIERILKLGVQLKLNCNVGETPSLSELRAMHDVLFLGIGAHQGRKLRVPGEEGAGVISGIDYLRIRQNGADLSLGRKVAVIGGGNTAVDAARMARRSGSDVTLLYRRTRKDMPAIASEINEALQEEVAIRYLVAPVRIVRNDGHIRALTLQRMRLGEPDDSGRRRPLPVEGSEHEMPVDSVIVAVSQHPDWRNLDEVKPEAVWPEADRRGKINETLWAAGDVLNLGIASRAVGQGRLAAESLHADLRGMQVPPLETEEPIRTDRVKLDYYSERERVKPGALDPSRWLERPDQEIHYRITEEEFQGEVERCLSCGNCFGCEHCWMYCAHSCFTRLEKVEPGAYFSVALDRCQSCGKCIDLCPCGFLQVKPEGLPQATRIDPLCPSVGRY